MARNPYYRSIQRVINDYERRISEYSDDIEEQANNPLAEQLDTALGIITKSTALKIIHPLFIAEYRRPRMKYRSEPINCIGFDVETDHTTGEPKLFGVYHPAPIDNYRAIFEPTLNDFYEVVEGLADNGESQHIAVWGNLDIQVILRLFDPTETERSFISRGLSANVKGGEFIGDPPLMRMMNDGVFYVAHYIPGRSLKLGILKNGYESTIWVFNLSQFFPGTIAKTAKALQLKWIEYDKSTHLIDWNRYKRDRIYRKVCNDSNAQDAKTVQVFSEILQARFYATFDAYPNLLVSTGSLTDAAVARMLDGDDYKANSWSWLRDNVWQNQPDDVLQADLLLSEAFSAGYVDQYGMGFFGNVCTADIAAAYPHKIRNLPDLRYSHLASGTSLAMLDEIRANNDVETVIFRGLVSIPKSLHFHPITIKTYNRDNYRPSGTFYAAYTWEEREYCSKHGATFADEDWIAVIIDERRLSSIAQVSKRLGELRDQLLAQMAETDDADAKIFLDGQQFVTKVIDNSIYGKTVMTTEYVENVDGEPQITGYIAGDRFNLLYGALITSRTRIQIAEACTAIERAGGKPIMTMTDSIYWVGTTDMLPADMIRVTKTPGYFESPHIVSDFFILKTGQYEYKDRGKWFYKLRGLNVAMDEIAEGKYSFYRREIAKQTGGKPKWMHPKDVAVRVNTRRLISIGAKDMSKLGRVEESVTDIKPFVLSSKQSAKYVFDWKRAINGYIWFDFITVKKRDAAAANYPLFFLRESFEESVDEHNTAIIVNRRMTGKIRSRHIKDAKRMYVWKAIAKTQIAPPSGKIVDISWTKLQQHFGLSRESLN